MHQQKSLKPPKVGDYVRLQRQKPLNYDLRSYVNSLNSLSPKTIETELYEGVVSGMLFDNSIEVSFIEDDVPKSIWINLKDPKLLEFEILYPEEQ